MKKLILFISFFILFFFFTGLSLAQESQYSFNLHASYNSGGDLFPGDPPRSETYYQYIDSKIIKIGNIEMIRLPGVIPKKLPDDQCPSNDTPPCFTDRTSATDWPYPWPDNPVRHVVNTGAEVSMDLNLWEMWWDNGGISYVHDMADLQTLINITNKAIKRYDGDCDINENGNCTDLVESTQESPSLIFPKIRYWQIANEPGHVNWLQNETINVDGRQVMTLAYTIHEIAQIIKNFCSDCKIILPGAAFKARSGYFQEFLSGPQNGQTHCVLYDNLRCGYYRRLISDLNYLKGNGPNNFDIFDFHLHNQQNITDSTYTTFKDVTNTVLSLLASTGHANIPIWVTETSSWTGSPNAETWMPNDPYPSHSEYDQAAELVKQFLYPFSLGIRKVFWSPALIEGTGNPNNGYWSNIGLIFSSGVEKGSFCTLKMLTNKLATFSSSTRIDMGDPNIYLLRFSNFQNPNKTPVYAIWQENPSSIIDLSGIIHGEVVVTNINNVVTQELSSNINVTKNPKIIEEKTSLISVSCTDLTLTPTPTPLPGDLDKNGKVDIYDYNQLISNFGKTGNSGWIVADINEDGKVDIYDFNTLVQNFGKTQ